MNRMFVREAGRGPGRRLALAVIDDARSKGYDMLYLDALHRHVEALSLCESLGFRRYETQGALFGGDDRAISMRMAL